MGSVVVTVLEAFVVTFVEVFVATVVDAFDVTFVDAFFITTVVGTGIVVSFSGAGVCVISRLGRVVVGF
jgi:hypothetical protein